MTELWSEEKKLRKEIEWAHQILDGYGAPRQHYNPYEGDYFDLNLAGRISVWLNPKNEAGWKITNDSLCKEPDEAE